MRVQEYAWNARKVATGMVENVLSVMRQWDSSGRRRYLAVQNAQDRVIIMRSTRNVCYAQVDTLITTVRKSARSQSSTLCTIARRRPLKLTTTHKNKSANALPQHPITTQPRTSASPAKNPTTLTIILQLPPVSHVQTPRSLTIALKIINV